MKCLFLDLSINTRVENVPGKRLEQIFREVGGNTGNLVFRYAISSHVRDELFPAHWAEGFELSKKEKFDAVVLGAANWLNAYNSFGNEKRAHYLRQMNLPTICIGLGCQYELPTMKKIDFPQETKDFLSVLKDLDALVLVRDETTFSQCEHYGLKRVRLIGCPSNFISDSLPSTNRFATTARKTSFSNVALNSGSFSAETLEHDLRLFQFAKHYITQQNFHNVAAITLGRDAEYTARDVKFFKSKLKLKSFLKPGAMDFEDWKKMLKIYFDVEQWLTDAKTWDLVLGTRIHGTMVALQAGTPAVLTAIDFRTQGLAEQMSVPYLKLHDFLKWKKGAQPADMLANAKFNFNDYLKRRRELVSQYQRALSDFGLTLSDKLISMGL